MLNKKRLAALSLSAVMAASTISIPVNAADFSDGAGVVTEDTTEDAGVAASSAEAESQSVEVTENAADEVGVTWQFAGNVEFHYNDGKYDDFTVTYDETDGENTRKSEPIKLDTKDPKQVKFEAATCQHAERVKMFWSNSVGSYDSGWREVTGGERRKDHDFTGEVKTRYYATENSTDVITVKHGDKVWAQDYTICTTCNKEEKLIGDRHEITIGHTLGKPTYTVEFKDKENISNIKANNDGTVAFENGKAVLINPAEPGYYYKVSKCTSDDGYVEKEKIPVAATQFKTVTVVAKSDNIVTSLEDLNKNLVWPSASEKPIDEDNIKMKKCSDSGWYKLEYTYEGGRKSTQEITVDAHHYGTYATAVFETEADANLCEVTWDAEKKELTVKNNSCYRTIGYTEVTHCKNENCTEPMHNASKAYEKPTKCNGTEDAVVESVDKKADPAGTHKPNETVKAKVVAWSKKADTVRTYSSLLDTLKSVKDYQKYVKISGRTDCEKVETITIDFICTEDQKNVAETMKVKVWAEEHKYVNEAVTKKLPTCTTPGVLEETTKCTLCGDKKETTSHGIPRLKHTNEIKVGANGIGVPNRLSDENAYVAFTGEKVVDVNGELLKKKGAELKAEEDYTLAHNANGDSVVAGEAENITSDKLKDNLVGGYAWKNKDGIIRADFGVYADVYTKCATCGGNAVALLEGKDNKFQSKVTITVVDIKKEADNGKAGSITLKATYKNGDKVASAEYTVPYFSSIEAYQARVEEAPINGFQKDANGKYLYYVDGKFQENVSGLVDYAGKKYLVEKGVLCDSVNGVTLVGDDAFYFFAYGVVQSQYTGVAMYDGQSFYIVNGKVDLNVNGLVPYNGGTFVFAAGRLVKEANGLYLDTDGTWYFTALGQVQTDYTGVALYDGEFFYIQNGKLAKDYKGTITYNGATFNVSGGQLYGPIKK